jgi:hypothetical protein
MNFQNRLKSHLKTKFKETKYAKNLEEIILVEHLLSKISI